MANVTQSIMVACDGSEQSLQAAKMAANLAIATDQPLKLLSVFPKATVERMVISGVMPDDLDDEQKDYGRKVFDATKEVLKGKIEPTEEVLLKGDPGYEIIEYLEANPGTHLVLGRRGHSLLRSLTLGSVSEKIVRLATSPVTVISE